MELKVDRYMIVKILLLMSLILLIFNGGNDTTQGIYLFSIHIKYSYAIIVILEFISLAYILFINRAIKIDSIVFLLVLKVILLTFMLLYNSDSLNNLKIYLSTIQSLILYLIMISIPTKNMRKYIINFMKFYFIVICVQTIYLTITVNLSGVEFWRIKEFILIPIGRSNFIASNIIMLFAFIISTEESKLLRNIFIVIAIIGMFFTRSKSAIVILVLLILSEFFNFNNIRRNKKKVLVGILSIGVLYLSIIILNDVFPDFFDTYKFMYDNLLSGSEGGTEVAFNGRFSLYDKSIDIIKDNLIFGIGLNYSDILGGLAHNFILDTLLRAGIFNLIILALFLLLCGINFIKNYKYDSLIKGALKMLFFILLHGLFEPNIGSFPFDLSMWIIIGICMRRCYELKEERIGNINNEN